MQAPQTARANKESQKQGHQQPGPKAHTIDILQQHPALASAPTMHPAAV